MRGLSPTKNKWKASISSQIPASSFQVGGSGLNSLMGGVSVQGNTYPRNKVGGMKFWGNWNKRSVYSYDIINQVDISIIRIHVGPLHTYTHIASDALFINLSVILTY
jgi:hypothetical protein